MNLARYLTLAVLTLSSFGACSRPDAAPASHEPSVASAAAAVADAPPDPAMEARTLFRTRCAVCHGDVGKGDGPGAAALNPKPRAFADAAWQQATTDDALRTIIVQGGPAVGKNAAMPPNPDLVSKPAVVVELIKIVRGFAPK